MGGAMADIPITDTGRTILPMLITDRTTAIGLTTPTGPTGIGLITGTTGPIAIDPFIMAITGLTDTTGRIMAGRLSASGSGSVPDGEAGA